MNLVKSYYSHRGVDLKSSDLIRNNQFATDMINAEYGPEGDLSKRRGFQGHALSHGGYGTWTYQRVNPTTGAQEPVVVTIDQNLYFLSQTTLNIHYAGANLTCLISFYLDISGVTNTYRCQIIEGTSVILNTDLGVGVDVGSPYAISALVTAINALTGFTATVTGATNTPAAFLKIIRDFDLVSADCVNVAKYWTAANATTTNPLSNYYAQKYVSSFENVSATQIQNVIYFGSGYSETMKFDGQTFYRAGLPNPAVVSTVTAGGAITGSNYVHRVQYIQHDAAGNIIEGNLAASAQQNAAAQKFSLAINNIQAGTGFNTNCAVVAGAQGPVNIITVDDGSGGFNTMKIGDTAYFYDAVSAGYVTRTLTDRNNFNITVSGAAVTVADNAVISNNLRIAIWRSKDSATTPASFYFIDEIPNNSFAATTTYVDNVVDGSLGELLFIPSTERSPPPRGKYISQWSGLLAIAGNLDNPTTFYYSDSDSPEYFPSNSNQLLIEPGNGDIIAGIAPNNEVFTIHGDVSFTVISGDLTSGQIRVETISRDTGCAAHATLIDIDGTLAWLSPHGPRLSTGGQLPMPLGPALDPNESNHSSRIDPAFLNDGKIEIDKLRLKRATACNDVANARYIIFVPAETGDSSLRYANGSSKVFAYDRNRDAWLIWNNYNFCSGAVLINDEFYLHERTYSAFSSSIRTVLYRRHNLIDAWDYADNIAPLEFNYAPQWESLSEPSVLKNAIHLKVFSINNVANNAFTVTVDQEINFVSDSAVASFDVDFTNSGGGYGISAYGDSAYGDPDSVPVPYPLNRGRIRSIRPRFRNQTIHENVAITGWEMSFTTPYALEFQP